MTRHLQNVRLQNEYLVTTRNFTKTINNQTIIHQEVSYLSGMVSVTLVSRDFSNIGECLCVFVAVARTVQIELINNCNEVSHFSTYHCDSS